jgi:DNA-binding FrmR family transcriptional regulator
MSEEKKERIRDAVSEAVNECCAPEKAVEECRAPEKAANGCCAPETEAEGCAHFHGIHSGKMRSEEEYKSLKNRLKRIEGQVRGIERMLDGDAYCPDILMQVSAVNSALNSFSKELLGSHIRTCVKDDILSGNTDTIEELVKLTQKLMR